MTTTKMSSSSSPYIVAYFDGENQLRLEFNSKAAFAGWNDKMTKIKEWAAYVVDTYPDSAIQTVASQEAIQKWLNLVEKAEEDRYYLLPSIEEVRANWLLLVEA